MKHILEKYLQYLNEFMPAAAIMPARQSAGYKQTPGPVNSIKNDEEEVEETSYNPDGSGYGMMFQRWGYTNGVAAKDIDSSIVNPSQKSVNKKIKITANTKDEDDEDENNS